MAQPEQAPVHEVEDRQAGWPADHDPLEETLPTQPGEGTFSYNYSANPGQRERADQRAAHMLGADRASDPYALEELHEANEALNPGLHQRDDAPLLGRVSHRTTADSPSRLARGMQNVDAHDHLGAPRTEAWENEHDHMASPFQIVSARARAMEGVRDPRDGSLILDNNGQPMVDHTVLHNTIGNHTLRQTDGRTGTVAQREVNTLRDSLNLRAGNLERAHLGEGAVERVEMGGLLRTARGDDPNTVRDPQAYDTLMQFMREEFPNELRAMHQRDSRARGEHVSGQEIENAFADRLMRQFDLRVRQEVRTIMRGNNEVTEDQAREQAADHLMYMAEWRRRASESIRLGDQVMDIEGNWVAPKRRSTAEPEPGAEAEPEPEPTPPTPGVDDLLPTDDTPLRRTARERLRDLRSRAARALGPLSLSRNARMARAPRRWRREVKRIAAHRVRDSHAAAGPATPENHAARAADVRYQATLQYLEGRRTGAGNNQLTMNDFSRIWGQRRRINRAVRQAQRGANVEGLTAAAAQRARIAAGNTARDNAMREIVAARLNRARNARPARPTPGDAQPARATTPEPTRVRIPAQRRGNGNGGRGRGSVRRILRTATEPFRVNFNAIRPDRDPTIGLRVLEQPTTDTDEDENENA